MTGIINKKLVVLFIGLKYDYGDPRRGYSYEYLNLFDTLTKMENISALIFPVDEIMREVGRTKMNHKLLDTIKTIKPDICFFLMFTDEIKKETIQKITQTGNTITLNWFADDHWRFDVYSKYWANLFHYVVTTDEQSVGKYHHIGCSNVILSQWGYNHHVYKSVLTSERYDVTFVGQVHSTRNDLVHKLQISGIDIKCWGKGWPNGRLTHQEMMKVYSASKINLNFTDSSPGFHIRPLLKVFLTRRSDNTFRVNNFKEMRSHLSLIAEPRRHQIKGRNFEIPGLGGFLLTEDAEGISNYFVPGKEIAIFSTEEELCEQVEYFLNHDKEREAMRLAGHERALKEHTFEKRFENIFNNIKKTTERNTDRYSHLEMNRTKPDV